MTKLSRQSAWVDTLFLLVLTTVLIAPLFRLEYLNNWPSIESTFIADARMLAENLPHPGWQPLWYCGTRFDYIYPPALRYGTAFISKFASVSTARAYHFYTGLFYVFGIAAVYWLVRIGKRSRGAALLAAAWVALLSPSFLVLRAIRYDSGWVPQRLHVLMAYGEGPHISALSVLPAALAASFLALRSGSRIALAGAAALCALTVANNFYGATALAIFFPIVAWSVWVGKPDHLVWLRALSIPALAYGLSAFWLTPSYLLITSANLKLVSLPGSNSARLTMLAVAVVFCVVSWRWARRRPERSWTVFVAGAAIILTIYVVGFINFGFRVLGDAQRLVPELDMALILVFLELLWALWTSKRALRIVAIAIALIATYPATWYLRNAYDPFPSAPDFQNQYEYRMSQWVHDHLPGERVLPSGTVRFWFDAWFDNAQMDGGSLQGMLNQVLPAATWQIPVGDRGDVAVLWMQALGTDAVIVPDRTSFEHYHDYPKPEKFRGVVPVLYDDQHGTIIYRIPRRFPSIGRVVEAGKLAEIGPMRSGDDLDGLTRYVGVVDSPDQSPTAVQWKGFDEMDIHAQVPPGRSVLLQETYDPAWHADENGRGLAIRPEPVMGFMLIDLPEGSHTIQLRFETPLENRIGQVVFGLALLVVFMLVLRPQINADKQR